MRGKRISLLRQRLAGDTPAAEVFPIGANYDHSTRSADDD
jgi:hypothetical protein